MTSSRFRRRRTDRKLVLDGDFPDTGESVTELLAKVRPADYDGTTVTFGGASVAGLDPASVYGSPVDSDAADAAAGLRQAIELTALAERGPATDALPAPHAESSLQILDLTQVWQVIGFLRFRTSLDTSHDSETVARASRVLRAEPDASLSVRVWGLDPDDPGEAADFSDVSRSLSEWAQDVWGKHAGGAR